jgi:hypothetical protein
MLDRLRSSAESGVASRVEVPLGSGSCPYDTVTVGYASSLGLELHFLIGGLAVFFEL